MTLRQKLSKLFYPAIMFAGQIFGTKAGVQKNSHSIHPTTSFYSLTVKAIDGEVIEFRNFKNKNVLIVNTASGCGYTNQFAELEQLQSLYKQDLVVIGFPSNDFKEQETLTNEEIASFCTINFNVSFLLAQKSRVIKGGDQNNVYSWLSNKTTNGWNDKDPEWNFSKYLVNKNGILTHYYGPGVAPLSSEVTANIM